MANIPNLRLYVFSRFLGEAAMNSRLVKMNDPHYFRLHSNDVMKKNQNLFSEFSPVSREKWEEVIKNDLRGGDYKQKLRWNTSEGITALPFYRRDDLQTLPAPLSVTTGNWEIRQPITLQDIPEANKAARKAVTNSAEAITFKNIITIDEGKSAFAITGPQVHSQETFRTLLDGIDPQKTPIHFDAGPTSPIFLAMLHNDVEKRELNPEKITGSLLYDPCAFALINGRFPNDAPGIKDEFEHLVTFAKQHMPHVKTLGVDARPYHNAGGTIVEEVTYALSTGSEYLALLSESDLSLSTIASATHFNLAAGSNYFLEIAKFRALRRLWSLILDSYGLDDSPPAYLHGESSQWNKTLYDPYVNMLRSTTEGMAAAIAGCDAITLHSFDHTFSQADEFSRRIARNSQAILKEEAYLDKVADPSAGSYYIETLTDNIAKAAWSGFQEVEQQGGMMQVIRKGSVQEAINNSQKKRDQAVAMRQRIFVGTNQYPNVNDDADVPSTEPETPVFLDETDHSFEIDPNDFIPSLKKALKQGRTLGDLLAALTSFKDRDFETIYPYRGAKAFEELRKATRAHASTPKVMTLPMGNKKLRKARAAFTVNFFGCAGYKVVDPIGFKTTDEAVASIKEEQPDVDVVVLCSSDEEYETVAPELCTKLNELDEKPIIVLAGYPKKNIEEFRDAGIDSFIHAKCNVLETLQDFQKKLGIIEHG